MEIGALLSSSKPSISTYFPFFLSYNSPFLEKPKLSVKTHLSLPLKFREKTQFWGQNPVFREKDAAFGGTLRKPRLEPIRAVVKRRKELPFDNVIQKDKKLKLMFKIRKLLVDQPERIMAVKSLGKFRKQLGLKRNRRIIAVLRKFPGVFEIVEKGAYSLTFKLTPEAEKLYLEEMELRNQSEDLLVIKLRKLLMMSLEKRILLEKIAHLKTDLGLPLEFRDTICQQYPEYFRVVATERGPALELTHWDPDLAVSAAELSEEDNRARELEENDLIIDRPIKFNRVKLPKGLHLTRGEMRRIFQFRDIPYISPYSDFSALRPGTPEKEKHACGVVHEMLSLTVEKRTLVDHLTHFREEFRFSQQLRGMLIRHPDMFYVSLKGERDSVFLREAYRDSKLIDKDPFLVIKEKYRGLVDIPKFRRRGSRKLDADGKEIDETKMEHGEEGEEDSDIDGDGGWSDDEQDGNDGDEDDSWLDGDDDEDDWSDEDDDTPPEFNDDDNDESASKQTKSIKPQTIEPKRVLVPAFPDGRPRERW